MCITLSINRINDYPSLKTSKDKISFPTHFYISTQSKISQGHEMEGNSSRSHQVDKIVPEEHSITLSTLFSLCRNHWLQHPNIYKISAVNFRSFTELAITENLRHGQKLINSDT